MDVHKGFLLVAEGLAVATAACFVLSGVANGAIFHLQWGLNYFVIATPSDVAMTAFIFALWAVVIAVVLGIVGVLMAAFVARKPATAGPDAKPPGPFVRGATLIAGLVTLLLLIGEFTREVEPAPGRSGRQAAPLFSYNTGLRLTPNRTTGDDCWAAPVLWMGAERIVVGCQSGVQVISNADDRAFQNVDWPVPARPEFLADEAAVDMVMPELGGPE